MLLGLTERWMRVFADVMKLKILKWGGFLDYPGTPLNVITRVLIIKKGRYHATGFGDRGKGHEVRNERNKVSETENGKDVDSPLEENRGSCVQALLTRWNWLWTSDFQICKRISVHDFKPYLCGHSYWAIANKYIVSHPHGKRRTGNKHLWFQSSKC